MTYTLAHDWELSAKAFKAAVLAFNNTEAAAEVLTGLTVDEYSDLEEDEPLAISFYHALNPQLIK
jgi:hypothetical protein